MRVYKKQYKPFTSKPVTEIKQYYHYMPPDMEPGPFLVINLYGFLLPESAKHTKSDIDNINNELLKYLLDSDKKIIIVEQISDAGYFINVIKQLIQKTGLSFFGFFPTVAGYSPPFLNCWKKINEICDFSKQTGNFLGPNLSISTEEVFIKQKCFSNNVMKDTFLTYNSVFNKPEIKISTKITKEYLTNFVKREETKIPDADVCVIYGNHCSGKSFLANKLQKSGFILITSDFSEEPDPAKKYVLKDYCNNNSAKSAIIRKFKKFNRKVLFIEMSTPKEICRLLNYVLIESNPEIPFYNMEDYEITYEKNTKFDQILFNIKLDLTNGLKIYY